MHRDFSEPLTAEDRAIDALIDAASRLDLVIGVPCRRCGRYLFSKRSVVDRLGAKCRAAWAEQEAA